MATRKEHIARLVHEVVQAVQPLKVILFGSQARGEASNDSDVDLLVVMPEGAYLRQVSRQLYRDIPRQGIALDVLVATPALLERHRDNPGLIYHTILKEGREVYVAGNPG